MGEGSCVINVRPGEDTLPSRRIRLCVPGQRLCCCHGRKRQNEAEPALHPGHEFSSCVHCIPLACWLGAWRFRRRAAKRTLGRMPSAVALGRLGALVLGRREGDRLIFLNRVGTGVNRVGTGVTEASARDLRRQLDPLRSTSRWRRSRANCAGARCGSGPSWWPKSSSGAGRRDACFGIHRSGTWSTTDRL